MKPAGAGPDPGTGAVEVRVERPQRPPVHPNPARLRARPYYRRWTPWLVPAASIACVAVFLVTMFVNDCPNRSSGNCSAGFLGRFAFQPLKENPLLGPSSTTLLKMGALDVSKVVQGRQGWRLITCIWLHAGVVHLLINVLCLLFIGIRLEQEFGFVRIGLVYLISGFGGSLMSALFIRASISVGASGALFGLIGSMLSELITNWSLYANKVAALLTLVLVIVVNLALGILPRVDNFAHIGGLISGFLLGFVVFIRPQFAWINQRRVTPGPQTAPAERKHKTYQYILWIVAAILLIIGFTVAIVTRPSYPLDISRRLILSSFYLSSRTIITAFVTRRVENSVDPMAILSEEKIEINRAARELGESDQESGKPKTKPTGYEFYREVLGSPRYVVAPMVDASELAWRILSRYYGAELCYTPMIHAGLYSDERQIKYRSEQLDLSSSEEGHPSLDRPLIVQFCANHPDTLLKAAKLVVDPCSPLPENIGVDAIDLNLGCPQGIAKKGKYGAFLMDHPDLITQLISHLDQHIPVPVTAKYRRFDTTEKTENYTERLIDAGAQMISLHGRTREQKGQLTGLADWGMMKAGVIRSHARGRPILGNGNVLIARDVEDLLRETGADGVMVAEGNLYNPAIFAPINGVVMARFRAGLPDRFKVVLDRVEEEYEVGSGKFGSRESLLEFPTSSKVASQYLAICRTLKTRTASSAIKGHLHKIFRAVFETGRYDDLRNRLGEVSWGSTDALMDSNASAGSHKRRDRSAYDRLLDRFEEVIMLIKDRLEDDRLNGLLDEHQIDMTLTRAEGESSPSFLGRLRVPYSRCQPYIRGGLVVQPETKAQVTGCRETGCMNSGSGRCEFGLCKRCCKQQSMECAIHLRRAGLEENRSKRIKR